MPYYLERTKALDFRNQLHKLNLLGQTNNSHLELTKVIHSQNNNGKYVTLDENLIKKISVHLPEIYNHLEPFTLPDT